MSPAVGLLAFLVLTLLLLGGVVVTGRCERRLAHAVLSALAMASLAAAIAFAVKLGERFDLDAAGLIRRVHDVVAKTAVPAFAPAFATGFWALGRSERALRWHRITSYIALGLTVAAAVTGTWMILAAEPLGAL